MPVAVVSSHLFSLASPACTGPRAVRVIPASLELCRATGLADGGSFPELGRVGRHQASFCEKELKVGVERNSVWLGLCPSNSGHEVAKPLAGIAPCPC